MLLSKFSLRGKQAARYERARAVGKKIQIGRERREERERRERRERGERGERERERATHSVSQPI